MDLLLTILAIAVAVIIAIIPYIYNKYFRRPELTIEIRPDGGLSSPMGLSAKNDFSKGYVQAGTEIRIFKLTAYSCDSGHLILI